MRRERWGPAAPVLAAVLGALMVACGAASQASHRPSHPHRSRAVTVQGSLVQVNATTLTVQESVAGGTVRVTFAPMATPIYAVTTVTTAAIEPGSCVAARGERDANGTVVASAVMVTISVDDTCPTGSEPPPPPPADPSPSGSAAPPSPAVSHSPLPGPVLLSGQVLSLGGGAIAIEGPQGDPEVILLPPGVRILFFQPSGQSALVIPSCVVAQGTRTPHAIAARKIVDWPPGTEC